MIPERYSLLKVDAAGVGLCAASSLLFYWLTIQPFLQRQSVAAEQRGELKSRQDKVAELKAAIAEVHERVTAVQTDLAASSIQLEPAAHINRRVAGLTQFFSDCELDIDDVQTGRLYSGLQYDLVPITVLGRGPYGQCVKFFRGLRAKFPDMSVARIELSGNVEKKAEEGTFQFDLLWYAAPDPDSVARKVAGGAQDATLGN